MIAIAAVDENFGIGYKNRLLARLPADMKRFTSLTTGNTVIMGRKTFDSIPNAPLPDRETLLLTKKTKKYRDVKCFMSVTELLAYAADIENEVYVCGGEIIYRELIPYCEKALITKVYHKFEADTWFPNLDILPQWEIANRTEALETNDYIIRFIDYINHEVYPLK